MSIRSILASAVALCALSIAPSFAASADCPTAPLFSMSGPVCASGSITSVCGCSECIEWDASAGATFYEIQRCDDSGNNCVVVGDTRRGSHNTYRAKKTLWCAAWDTPFPHRGALYRYSIRACVEDKSGPLCSTALSDSVEYAAAPYMCIADGVEVPCTDARTGTSTPSDLDGDGIPDVLDPDIDGDGIPNAVDNCPLVPNVGQRDSDHDGIGDACDPDPHSPQSGPSDADGDGVGDLVDNCPSVPNASQKDSDADGVGDACDNCPNDWNREQTDTDADGVGDVCDTNDGVIYLVWSSATHLSWHPESGYSTWCVYRGDLSVLRKSGVYTQAPGTNPLATRWCGLGASALADATRPAAGAGAFYLATGRSSAAETTLGTDSGGKTRPNTNPCP
jgi:hypothetical protein